MEDDLGKSREGSRTDDEVVQRFVLKFILSILSPHITLNETNLQIEVVGIAVQI